jgi:hypothetical protein
VLLVAAAAAVLLLALCTGSHAVAGNELDGLSSDGGFVPLEFGSLGSVDLASSDSMSLSTSPTDRELFNDMSGATGLPEPPKPPLCIGLNLVASLPCAIYLCRPTLLEGISIILNPSSPEALEGLGDVDLKLTAEYGAISFTTTEGQHTQQGNLRTSFLAVVGLETCSSSCFPPCVYCIALCCVVVVVCSRFAFSVCS